MNKLILRKPFKRSMWVNLIVSVVVILTWFVFPSISKAQVSNWSLPRTIPSSDLTAWTPILIADQDRTVHAFSSQLISNEDSTSIKAIVYNQWTLDNGWTEPIDIMLSPNKEARLTDVYLDKNGMFHMSFFGGDNTGADIYYSKAPLVNVNDAHAWSTPIIIGKGASDPAGAVFTEDDQGNFYVIFNGRSDGNGLYIVNSDNGGENWSNPSPIFFAISDTPYISDLEIVKGKSGWFHAIWHVYNLSGQGRRIYYSRSQDGNVWGEPVLLAKATEGLGTQNPTIIEYNDALIVIYNILGKIRMQYSNDDGKAWSDPAIIFPRHVGVNGIPSLIVDSNNELHMLFGQRISGSPDIHGMWHSIYINGRWLEPDAVIKGPRVTDIEGNKGFDPGTPRAVISQGNTILVTWRTDPAAGVNGIWYSFKTINAPELPTEGLPSGVSDGAFVLTGTPPLHSIIFTPTIFSSTENNALQLLPADDNVYLTNPSISIALGSILALFTIIVIVVGINKSRRR